MKQLGVLAKYWQPGHVKTRLAASIGEQAASDVYRQFVGTLLRRFADLADRRVLNFAPVERQAAFASVAGGNWNLRPQAGADLGERMYSYFREAFERGAHKVLLIGSDSPTLPKDYLLDAWRLLERHDCVIGPATDGGYYLVGARGRIPPIFQGMPWSSSELLTTTMRRLSDGNCSFAQLPTWYDVDGIDDLRRLAIELLSRPEPEWESLRRAVNSALN